jgi:hypothetical protein
VKIGDGEPLELRRDGGLNMKFARARARIRTVRLNTQMNMSRGNKTVYHVGETDKETTPPELKPY